MKRRRSIHIDGFVHRNPIPNAAVVGNILVSGVIHGRDTREDSVPATVEEQCAICFRHIRDIVEAAGGSTDDIVKINFYLQDPSDRTALNAEWLRMFPDEHSRPARHAHGLDAGSPTKIQCDFMAVIG